jgi:hypothetical protein
MSVHVNVKSFVRAEIRQPTPLDHQPVIRMNRDTLYSVCVADISAGATLTVPDAGSRYVSVMIVNRDHYINRIIHDPGDHELTVDEFDTPFVAVAARILVDPARPEDVAAVAALQDGFVLRAGSAKSFEPPDYDTAGLDATRASLLELARGVDGFSGAFGAKNDVDPVMHLLGTAAGWGGLPEHEAFYLNVDPGLPVGRYRLRVEDVPVDGFWSISLYNAEGYFPDNGQPVSVNNLTAVADGDGAITVHFGDWDDDPPNRLPVAEGWNYLVRLYRPHPEILNGSWVFPGVEPA